MASTDVPDLERLFAPSSIALVGASGDPNKLSGRPYRYLREHDYPGDIYLVNPGRETIDGEPCYDSIADLPEPVDLALVLVPASLTTTVLAECGDRGVAFASVIASGFAETDEDGADRQAELAAVAREAGVRLVGPNSEGLINLSDSVGASFSSILKRDDLSPGGVSFVTQSGGFGGALFQLTQDRGLGASKWISTGNEVDLTTLDFLEYLVEDEDTHTVVTYVESLTDGDRLARIGRRAAETNTAIVGMRVGSSPRGEEAAASHTGSIATDDEIYDAVFTQAGVDRVWSIDEFVDSVTAFARLTPDRFPALHATEAKGVGVVSVSGGAAVLVADAAARLDVPLARLSAETVETLGESIPSYGSTTNPVDVTGSVISDPALFERCVERIVEDDATEALLLQFGNSGGETIEECKAALFDVQSRHAVPIATVFTGGQPDLETAAELREAGVLLFEDPVRAVRAFGKVGRREACLDSLDPVADAEAVRREGQRATLSRDDWEATVASLSDAGVGFVDTRVVANADEADAAATAVGYPVVLKVDPLAVEHKSEVGGVRVDLTDEAEVRAAYDELAAIDADAAVLVQPMVEGVEAIVGVVDDPDFGPVMLFGAGGVFVELFDEFAYRALPVTERMAREMIAETPMATLLEGYRHLPAGDEAALVALLTAVSDAYLRYDVNELELNPVIVTADGAAAVDLVLD